MKYLLVLLLFFTGCATHVTNLDDILPARQVGVPQHETIDSVLKYYFTDEAYNAVKDIPSIDTVTWGGSYVTGVNVWTNMLGIAVRLGVGRRVVLSLEGIKSNGVSAILHEYMHHIDDMTRDGDIDLISLFEFQLAWNRLEQENPKQAEFIDTFADRTITNLFGIGEDSERISYVLQHMIRYGGLPYFKYVYRDVIRNWR